VTAYGWKRERISGRFAAAARSLCTRSTALHLMPSDTGLLRIGSLFREHLVRSALAAFAECGSALAIVLQSINGLFLELHCITSQDEDCEKVLAAVAS
jgi:hypothetical protein